jgi:hypothetical protein
MAKTGQQEKIARVMREFKSGTLKSSSGEAVKSPKQALAIALSESGMSRKPKKDMSDEYYMGFLKGLTGKEEENEEEDAMDESTGEKRCKAYLSAVRKKQKKVDRGDAESFAPPSSVRAAARRGLELRKKHGKGGLTTQEAGKQGIGSGVARATSLANGEKVSYETIKRMAAFFSRHEKNKAGGEDDAGKISWDLWGGDAGRSWANGLIRMVESRKSDQ